ncbi:MAG: hypothetical protein QXK89_09035 [Candidatus Bathyarchaeia archaeon]
MIEVNELKAKFLRLLKEDEEFRYAVAGYIGFTEVLKRLEEHDRKFNEILARLDRHEEILVRHSEEIAKLREDMIAGFKRHDEEIAKLREDMVAGFKRHDEEFTKVWNEIAKLREDMIAGFKRHDEEIAKLREDMLLGFKRHDEILEKHAQEIARLREDFNKAFKQLDSRLSRVERTLEKITLDIEDEARIIIEYRLREMGYEVKLGRLFLPEAEINIYGVSDNLCVIGEASVRASSNLIDEISRNIEMLRITHPDKLRDRVIKVIYTSLAMPDLIEKAEKENIWVLKATGDITEPKILSYN